MVTIKDILATEILDSRGDPTIEATVILSDDTKATASIPSGASTGKHEAVELRDNDPNRYRGKGVLQAIRNITEVIAPKLKGVDVVKQGAIDTTLIELDGTESKSNLGANALLAVSLAVCRGAANATKMPLYHYIAELIHETPPQKIDHMPTPTFNIINGGKHGGGNLDIQEFHIVAATIKSFHESLQMSEEIYHRLATVLVSRNASQAVGDEGGYAPNLYTNTDALEAIMEAIHGTKYRFGFDVFLGLDVAATELYRNETYYLKDNPGGYKTEEFIEYFAQLHTDFHLLLLEDPLSEDDWKGWQMLTARLGREVLIIGDDLLTTNPTRLKRAIDEKACSAILIKPNQIGTLSETLVVAKQAKAADFKTILSHRSGETNDTFIADLAVGIGTDYVKFGAPARGERVAKYNRLLEIERELKLI